MNEDNKLLNVNELDIFITNYKAVYHAMTAKHDCKSKIFPRNVKVSQEDILNLNDQVLEKLKIHNDAGFSISVTVSFVGKQTIEFSTWTEFENHKWNESNAITSITIIWEFNALLPQYQIPQKHVLVVKIADSLRPEEMINIVFAGKLENIDDIEKQMYPVVARVDFINYVLGDELLHIVEEWNDGLTLQEATGNSFTHFVKKHKRKISYGINFVTNAVVLICSIKIVISALYGFNAEKLSDLTINNIKLITYLVGFLFLFGSLMNRLSEWLANIFYRTLEMNIEQHVFDLNNGDKKLQQHIHKAYKKNKLFTIGSIIMTFLINLVCAIVCSFLVN